MQLLLHRHQNVPHSTLQMADICFVFFFFSLSLSAFKRISTIITLKIERETKSKTCVTHKSSQRWQQLWKYFLVQLHSLWAIQAMRRISSYQIDTYEQIFTKATTKNCKEITSSLSHKHTHIHTHKSRSHMHQMLERSNVINTLPHKCNALDVQLLNDENVHFNMEEGERTKKKVKGNSEDP